MKISALVLIIFGFFPALTIASNFGKDYKEHGKASYYGKQFHGRLTANGETFNMHALTAAHKTLPFNTLVRVTDLSTGKQIMVRINDRGPFIKGRNIDLSKGAARELDIIQKGIADVQIEIVRLGTGEEEDSIEETSEESKVEEVSPKVHGNTAKPTGKTFSIWGQEKEAKGYGIQIGSFVSKKQMLAEAKKAYSRDLKDLYVQSVQINGKTHYRILFLARDDRDALAKALTRVRKMGYRQAFVRAHL